MLKISWLLLIMVSTVMGDQRVNIPPRALEAAARVLKGPTSQWRVQIYDWASNDQTRVFCISEHAQSKFIAKSFICEISKEGEAKQLNHEDGLPAISSLLKSCITSEDDLQETANVLNYVDSFMKLRVGPHGFVGSSIFLKRQVVDAWMHGTEKKSESFEELCRDPIIKKSGSSITIVFNYFNTRGGVVRWTLLGSFDAYFRLAKADCEIIKADGTFYFPIEG